MHICKKKRGEKSQMAIYRNVHLSFWTDNKVADDFTPEDKYFYLYLFTNPQTNLCGCYEVSLKQIANQTGYNRDTIERLIERFEKVHKVIVYSKESKEILLLNWYKYNWTKSEKFLTGLDKSIREVKDKEFKRYLLEIRSNADTVSIPYANGMDTTVTFSFTDIYSKDNNRDLNKDNKDISKDNSKNNSKGKNKIPKKSKVEIYYPNDEKLNQTFMDFLDMRNQMKKSMTDRAISLAMSKLQKLSQGDNEVAIQILEQSIFRNWIGLFPLNDDNSSSRDGGSENRQSQFEYLLNSIKEDEENDQNRS